MDKLVIEGGVPLSGEVRVSGAKNATLPILCAALLTTEPLIVTNVPHLRDVTTMLTLLGQLGVTISVDERLGVELSATRITAPLAPYELVRTMRASELVLGALAARCGEARVSLPVLNAKTTINRGFDTYTLMEKHNDMAAMLPTLRFSDDVPSYYLMNIGETHYPYALPSEPSGPRNG